MTSKLHDIDIDEYLSQCTAIEPLALQEEFVRWSGDYAYWNERYSKANKSFVTTKLEREKLYSQLMLEIRNSSSNSKMTVGEVESRILIDDRYTHAKQNELEFEIELERLAGVLQALRGKKDMLIQLGYHQRAEMQGDPVLKEYLRENSKA